MIKQSHNGFFDFMGHLVTFPKRLRILNRNRKLDWDVKLSRKYVGYIMHVVSHVKHFMLCQSMFFLK